MTDRTGPGDEGPRMTDRTGPGDEGPRMTDPTPPGDEGPRPFFSDFVELVYGVFFTPVQTLRDVARRAAPPIGAGLLAYVLAAGINGLAAGGSVAQALRSMATEFSGAPGGPVGAVPAAVPGGAVTLALIGGFAALFFGWVGLFLKAGVLSLVSSLLGGRGDPRALLAALGLTYLPVLVAAPAALVFGGRPVLGALSSLVALGVLLWRLVLDIIAIREVSGLTTGLAVAAALLPVGVALILAIAFIVFIMVIVFGMASPFIGSGLPGAG
ncbi:MAG: Yip1 family protein [Bacillota bacterium]